MQRDWILGEENVESQECTLKNGSRAAQIRLHKRKWYWYGHVITIWSTAGRWNREIKSVMGKIDEAMGKRRRL